MENIDIYKQDKIIEYIISVREKQVILDRDIATLYGVSTKRLNEQVKRNIERFPETFRFQLTEKEFNELVADCDRFTPMKHSSTLPYAFTEQGVSMLSAVLHSDIAIQVGRLVFKVQYIQKNRLVGTETGYCKT